MALAEQAQVLLTPTADAHEGHTHRLRLHAATLRERRSACYLLAVMDATQLSLDARLVCPPEVLSRVLDGEAVLLDLAGGRYFGANEVGSFAWERIVEGTTLAELVARVTAEFEIDEPTAEADLRRFVVDLLDRGLVRIG